MNTLSRIPLSEPDLRGRELEYVTECVETGWVSSSGLFVTRLEEWAAEYFGGAGAVAVSSGTAALHIALMLAGVGPDDLVVMPTLTFIAPANAVRYLGATPVFIDAEPKHFQLDVDLLRQYLEGSCDYDGRVVRERSSGRRVAAVLPVHVLGHPCSLDLIASIAETYRLPVVEDASESLGSFYRGRPAGGIGDFGCVSFNGNKIATAGGGGMIVVRNQGLTARARYLTTQAKVDPVEYVHGDVGFNYRLTNVQAAIGLAQVEQLEAFVRARRAIAKRYAHGLSDIPGLTVAGEGLGVRANFWLSAVVVDAAAFGVDRQELSAILRNQGIETRPLWQPMHRSPAHRREEAGCGRWVADRLHDEVLCLPSSSSLRPEDQDRVIHAIAASARA